MSLSNHATVFAPIEVYLEELVISGPSIQIKKAVNPKLKVI